MLRLNKGIWMVGVPFVFSVLAVIKHSIAMFILFILVHGFGNLPFGQRTLSYTRVFVQK